METFLPLLIFSLVTTLVIMVAWWLKSRRTAPEGLVTWIIRACLVAACLLMPVIGVALILVYWLVLVFNGRRSRQARLLWLMTIATENRLPLADELRADAETYNGPARERTLALADRLEAGMSLGEALQDMRTPLLAPATVAAIRVGEETGTLQQVLRREAIRNTAALNESEAYMPLRLLMIYYTVVIGTILSLTVFLMIFIVPKFRAIFDDFGVELPHLTRLLIDFSDTVSNFWYLAALAMLAAGVALVTGFVIVQSGWENARISSVMKWFPRRDTPGILRALRAGIAANVPLPQLFGTIRSVQLRPEVYRRLDHVVTDVEYGTDPWTAMKKQQLLHDRERLALSAASEGNRLGFVLPALADRIEETYRRRLLTLVELSKPVVVFIVGTFVAFYAVAFFLPLVKLLNDLS
ncbi:Type II secretion system protein F [Maioricimonas rarisocia]|uniref:Type II secretion system protein F n=1 Tax=Maioricimonas rarisocia TaxID=2528026 RepID=A0A517ZBU9_9PLAN|nr:type II secretion system F family protein [Maioricimonas rarisocia]QDU39976.1 Type II secretion system protein F [Maioricimonas rarisocia]